MKKLFLAFIAVLLFAACAGTQKVENIVPQNKVDALSATEVQALRDMLKYYASNGKSLTLQEIQSLATMAGASNFYGAIGLTGGTTGALDAIDGTSLADGDAAYVVTPGGAASQYYVYVLDDNSAAAESSPDVISPDDNAGDKRWILVFHGDAATAELADLAVTDSNFMVANGTTWVAESGATARTSMGVAIGTDVQAYSATLASLAGLTETNGGLPYGTADNAYAWLAAGAEGTLLMGNGAGAPSWLAAGTLNYVLVGAGAADPVWTQYLTVPSGGTGAGTLTDHGILLGSGTDAVTPLAAATNGQLPIGSTGADPVLGNITETGNALTITNGAGTIDLAAQAALESIAGLVETNGGLPYGTADNTYAWLAAGAEGTLLMGNGAGAPSWLAAGATTDILVGGGAADPVWTAATGTGAPVRANNPMLITPVLGAATGTSIDFGTTTLLASRALTVDTGGVFNVNIGSAAGDDFTVDGTKLVVKGDTGKVGIGTAIPLNQFSLVGTSYPYLTNTCYNDTENIYPVIQLQKSDGTEESPGLVDDNAVLGELSASGHDGIDLNTVGAKIRFMIDGTPAANRMPTEMIFYTAPGLADNDLTQRMVITPGGNVGIGTATPNAATKLDVVGAIRASTGILFGTDTAAANTLDDYEEGTWTPVLSDGTDDATMMASTAGAYVKIGNRVFILCHIATTSLGSVNGNLRITGLPFTIANLTPNYSGGVSSFQTGLNITAGMIPSVQLAPNNTYGHIEINSTTSGTAFMQDTQWTADGRIDVAFSYYVS